MIELMLHKHSVVIGRLILTGTLMGTILLSACGNQPAKSTDDKGNVNDRIDFVAWVVPESARLAYVQVRITPHSNMDFVTLTAKSEDAGVRIKPAQYVLAHLKPWQPSNDALHNPPAMGVTELRTFEVDCDKPGNYRITVSMILRDTMDQKTVSVSFK